MLFLTKNKILILNREIILCLLVLKVDHWHQVMFLMLVVQLHNVKVRYWIEKLNKRKYRRISLRSNVSPCWWSSLRAIKRCWIIGKLAAIVSQRDIISNNSTAYHWKYSYFIINPFDLFYFALFILFINNCFLLINCI